MQEDGTAQIVLMGSDVEGDALQFQLTAQPQHGSVSGSAPNLMYTPNADYFGSDSIKFVVSDGQYQSREGVIAISITPVNDLPSAMDSQETGVEDNALAFSLQGVDIDSDSLVYEVVSAPTNGTITGTAPNLIYTPETNFHGTDSLQFRLLDDYGSSNIATVTFVIGSENDAPIAESMSLSLDEDSSLAFELKGTDSDEHALAFNLLSLPRYGELTGEAPNLTYTPNKDYAGQDQLTFLVSDGSLTSGVVTVGFTIKSVNDLPIAQNDFIEVTKNSAAIAIEPLVNDTDIEHQVLTLVSAQADNGFVEIDQHNTLLYRPANDFIGQDIVYYSIEDSEGGAADALIYIDVRETQTGLMPLAVDDVVDINGAASIIIDVLANDYISQSQVLTLTSVNSDYGEVSIENNHVKFSPDDMVSGELLVEYTVSDQFNRRAKGYVIVNKFNELAPSIEIISTHCNSNGIQAQSFWTHVPVLAGIRAVSSQGYTLPITSPNLATHYLSGRHYRSWLAQDSNGLLTVAQEKICIQPEVLIVSNTKTSEGRSNQVEIKLSGEAPSYPVVLPISYGGTATRDDFSSLPESIEIRSGLTQEFTFDVLQDGFDEESEVLEVNVTYLKQAVAHSILVEPTHLAPEVELSAIQQGVITKRLSNQNGVVSIVAAVNDETPYQQLNFEWFSEQTALQNVSTNVSEFQFDPSMVEHGTYTISVIVTDGDAKSTKTHINVFVDTQPTARVNTIAKSTGAFEYGDRNKNGIQDSQETWLTCNLLPTSGSLQNVFIQSTANVCLGLGKESLKNGAHALVNKSGFVDGNTSLITDAYDISLVPHSVESTYNVILPLSSALPSGSRLVYWKNDSWQDYDLNRVESYFAPNNACSLGTVDWQFGIITGANCIKLSGEIEHSQLDLTLAVANDLNAQSYLIEDKKVVTSFNQELVIDLASVLEMPSNLSNILSAYTQLGFVSLSNTEIRFAGLHNFFGENDVFYTLELSNGDLAQGKLTIETVNNTAPEPKDDISNLYVGETVTANLLNNDIDHDGDRLTLVSVSHEIAFDASGEVSFTASSHVESVTVNYEVVDEYGNTAQGQWHIKVTEKLDEERKGKSSGSILLMLILLLILVFYRCNTRVNS